MSIATSLPTSEWIESTLADLTLEQKLGQLLQPIIQPKQSRDDTLAVLHGIEVGGVTLASGTREQVLACTSLVQEQAAVPVVVATDLENGPGRIISNATQFPDMMAIAAADRTDYAYTVGKSAALEGRACGIHWSFTPIVDINANWENPITNTRGLGDDPERITRLSTAMIRGMQEHGLAACAKHFPGDGFDCRDQHLCTSVNPLRMDEWWRLSGRMFQQAIDAGVWTIMIGHIALPAYDPGDGRTLAAAPPATLSRKLMTELLRDTMGFTGLIVTDALGMGGVTSYAPQREEQILRVMDAGADVLLFAEVAEDFDILYRAVKQGRLSMERIEQSLRRILHLKELVGLDRHTELQPVLAEDMTVFTATAQAIADAALTVVQDIEKTIPWALPPGSKIFSMHVLGDQEYHVDGFDALLRAEGFEVTTFHEEGRWGSLPSREALAGYDAILVNYVFGPTWGTSRIRPHGNMMRNLALIYGMHLANTVSISFGSPYLQFEFPRMPVLINTYSPDVHSQAAVIRLLQGHLEATGKSPVDLLAPFRHLGTVALPYACGSRGVDH